MKKWRVGALGVAGALALTGGLLASPAQANYFHDSFGSCSDRGRKVAIVAHWEVNGLQVRLLSVEAQQILNTAAGDWASSMTVADKLDTTNLSSWSGNPAKNITISFPNSPWTSSAKRAAYVRASNSSGYNCGPIYSYPF